MPAFRRQSRQHLALWLAIAAVLLRAMIPDGFMPQHVGEHGVELVPCPHMGGMMMATVPASSHAMEGQGGDHHADADQDCPFAAAAAPSLPSAPLAFPAPSKSDAIPLRSFATVAAFAVFRILPPSRAPPQNA